MYKFQLGDNRHSAVAFPSEPDVFKVSVQRLIRSPVINSIRLDLLQSIKLSSKLDFVEISILRKKSRYLIKHFLCA